MGSLATTLPAGWYQDCASTLALGTPAQVPRPGKEPRSPAPTGTLRVPGDWTHLCNQLLAGPSPWSVCLDAGLVWMLLVSHPWVLGADQIWGLHTGLVT